MKRIIALILAIKIIIATYFPVLIFAYEQDFLYTNNNYEESSPIFPDINFPPEEENENYQTWEYDEFYRPYWLDPVFDMPTVGIVPTIDPISGAYALKLLKNIIVSYAAVNIAAEAVAHYGWFDPDVARRQLENYQTFINHVVYQVQVSPFDAYAHRWLDSRNPQQRADIDFLVDHAMANGGTLTLSWADLQRIGINDMFSTFNPLLHLDLTNVQHENLSDTGLDIALQRLGFTHTHSRAVVHNTALFNASNPVLRNLSYLTVVEHGGIFSENHGRVLQRHPSAFIRSETGLQLGTIGMNVADFDVGNPVVTGLSSPLGVSGLTGQWGSFLIDRFHNVAFPNLRMQQSDFVGVHRVGTFVLVGGINPGLAFSLPVPISIRNYHFDLSGIALPATPFARAVGIPQTMTPTAIHIPDITAPLNPALNFDPAFALPSLPWTLAPSITWPATVIPDNPAIPDNPVIPGNPAIPYDLIARLNAVDVSIDQINIRQATFDMDLTYLTGVVNRLGERVTANEIAITTVNARVDRLERAEADTVTAINSLPGTIIGDFSTINFDSWAQLSQVTERFPFSLPWDIQRFFSMFNVAGEPPVFTFDFSGTYFSNVGIIEINMANFPLIAQTIRFIVSLLFSISLIILSIKIVK